jgi:hypothetical protein
MFKKFKLSLTWFEPRSTDFLVLAAVAVLINVASVALGICPQGSAFSSFQAFYGFYTDFFYHGEIAQWLPYTAYGMAAGELALRWITPAMYLTGLAGAILHNRDALGLFRIALTLETLILATGVYLLARSLFRRRATVLFVGIGILGSTMPLFEINWNFRIFYLMPLIFYFLLRFSREKQPHFLWWACWTLVLSQIGVPAYYLPLHGLFFMLALCLLTAGNPGVISCLFTRRKKNILSFLGFSLTAFIYTYFLIHRLDGLQGDPSTPLNGFAPLPLNKFLGENDPAALMGLEKFLGFFWESSYNFICSVYVGILPVVFALYACLRIRRRFFWGFFSLLIFLALLSAGDPYGVTRAVYSLFPPLRFFPRIGYLCGLIRPLVIFMAGFGLEVFLNDLAGFGEREGKIRARRLLFGCGLLVFVLMTVLAHFMPPSRLFLIPSSSFYLGQYSAFLAVLLCSVRTARARNAAWTILALFALDILSSANLYLVTTPPQPSISDRKIFDVSSYGFQAARKTIGQWLQTPSRSAAAFQLSSGNTPIPDSTIASFVLEDTCLPLSDSEWMNQNVRELFQTRFELYRKINTYPQLLQTDFFPPQDYAFFRSVMGCSDAKLRLSNAVVFARSPEEAAKMLQNDTRIVLEIESQNGLPQTNSKAPAQASGSVKVSEISFNRLEARAEVTDPAGAWLYYADAYDPGWKASVDGRKTLILRANLAFKAVYLTQGKHTVRFWFFPGLRGIASYLLAISAVLFAGALTAMMIRLSLFPNPAKPAGRS